MAKEATGLWFGQTRPAHHGPVRGKLSPMTLIAIALSDAGVIVGADGKGVYPPDPENGAPAAVVTRTEKFAQVQGEALVIGGFGSSAPYRGLVDWAQTMPITNWWTLAVAVSERAALVNLGLRENRRAAGGEPLAAHELFTVVVAGCVGNDPGWFCCDHNGDLTIGTPKTFQFLGLLSTTAMATMQIYHGMSGKHLDSPQKVFQFLGEFSASWPDIQKPIDVWHLGPGIYKKPH